MEPNNFVPTRCASCNGHGLPQMFRPYCSVVCRALGLAGLAWRTKPYRVVDLQSGDPVSPGIDFDLTTRGIVEMRKKVERLREPAHEIPVQGIEDQSFQPYPPQVLPLLTSASL